jgi:hypothetical protein
MKLELDQDMETLIRMIESQRRTLARAQDRNEGTQVTDSLVFALRETQAELADRITEAYARYQAGALRRQ